MKHTIGKDGTHYWTNEKLVEIIMDEIADEMFKPIQEMIDQSNNNKEIK